jgi:membrane protein DedA with SNARE-associated domain
MHLIAPLIHEYGLIAVATIVALECLGFPVPGETALFGAAIDAGTKHDLNIGAVIIVAAGAAIVGRMIVPWRSFLFANAVSSSVWAVGYGFAAYWAGREFEHSHRHVAIFLVIIAVIVIIAVGFFVHRREAQLIADAERAMPGPLKLR